MITNFTALETLLSNSCFLVLFLNTIYYWVKIIFYPTNRYYWVGLVGNITVTLILTNQLILRWVESGHFPLSNLYESLLFLAWSLVILYSAIEVKTQADFLGVIISPIILCLVAFTDLSLPLELRQSRPLVPALQSNWLFMHVSVMIGSYASLLLGCILGILYLLFSFSSDARKTQLLQTDKSKNFTQINLGLHKDNFSSKSNPSIEYYSKNAQFSNVQLDNLNNFRGFLDNLSYRTIGIGFCFLTLGILSGAVWANETWGSYWSWDPKETWAFITWLIFATYLHTRLIGGWKGVKPALLASFGFIIIWICYLGVNLLGKGLHSYGFLQL